jgi:hypothetical protein
VRVITDLALAKGVSQPMFIRVEPSAGVKPGDSYAFTVVLRSGPCTRLVRVFVPGCATAPGCTLLLVTVVPPI